MNLFALSGLLAFINSLIFGIFSWVKGKKFLNKIWAIFNLSVAIWGLGAYQFSSTLDQEAVFFWLRVGHVGVTLIPVFFIHFVFELLEIKEKGVIFTAYVIGLIFFALNITDWLGITRIFIVNLRYVFNSFYVDSPPGPTYPFFVAFFLGTVVYAHYRGLKFLLASKDPIKRMQVRYFLLATALGFGGGGTAFLMVFKIDIYPILHFTVSLYPAIMTYAIFKYRLMDIDLARRYLGIYFSYVAAGSLVFIPLILLFHLSLFKTIILIFLSFLMAPYFHRWMTKLLQPAFFSRYSYWETLKSFWKKPRVIFTPGQLADALGEIPQEMGLESWSLFLLDRDRNVFVPKAYQGLNGVFDPMQAEAVNTLYSDDALVAYLENQKKLILRDELMVQQSADHLNLKAVLGQMDQIRALISLPLFVSGRLTGIFNLGPKRNKEVFHEKDVQLIEEILQIAEKHLCHIVFFENSLFFSGSVAHDIRKPFKQGIIDGYLADIRQGLENPQNRPVAEAALDHLKERLDGLQNMSEEMVNAFKNLETFLKGGFTPQRIAYGQKANEQMDPYRKIAREKGVVFEVQLLKRNIFVCADPLSVERILDELVTNAIKYTEQGKIMVQISQANPGEVLTQIADTGCGIPQEQQEGIWELFKRIETHQKTEGAGIGLAMVRQLVEANGGKIWVKSNVGQGSRFFFTLPAVGE